MTGDRQWLAEAYEIISNSIADDLPNAYDSVTGLVKGESSFLDWREQTYPKWMQPADIYESECLGTNAVHYQANIVLSRMAQELGLTKVAARHAAIAGKIKSGINRYLWLPRQGYYAQFRYGRNFKMVSPRSEALGEALCILFGIADPARAARMVSSVPVSDFGIPCIYPEIPGIPPYHNNAVWPFVQSYWALAAAKTGNRQAGEESIFNIYRAAALFLTNKENYVAENSDYAGTQINSSNMLWSLSGNLSLVHKLLFGLRFQPDRLDFHLFVPQSLGGNQSLSNLHYRNALLQIILKGSGDHIDRFLLDGKLLPAASVPATLTGSHRIEIFLSNRAGSSGTLHKEKIVFTPATPLLRDSGEALSWDPVPGADYYQVYKNGQPWVSTSRPGYKILPGPYAEYQVLAFDKNGVGSFASEPLVRVNSAGLKLYELEAFAPRADYPYKGFSGTGFVETATGLNTGIEIPVDVKQAGIYALDFTYANGNGPTNTENKCAIRTLLLDHMAAGTIVLPQRGKGEWSNWGHSNAVRLRLTTGRHLLRLSLEAANENMNGAINQAMLDNMRLILISPLNQ